MGEPLARGEFRFVFPANLNARWHGVILADEPSLTLEMYDIPPEVALRHGTRTGTGVEIVVRRAKTKLMLGSTELRQLRNPREEH